MGSPWTSSSEVFPRVSHPCHSSRNRLETIKNLVLPGIGAFIIVDNQTVKPVDLCSNFFLTAESLGRSRGLFAAELLQELNTEVRSNHIDESLDMVLQKDLGYFKKFSVFIATDVPEDQLLRLAALLWENNTPLLVGRACLRSTGLLISSSCKPRSK